MSEPVVTQQPASTLRSNVLTALFVAVALFFFWLFAFEGIRVVILKLIGPVVLAIWAWRTRQPKGVAKYQGVVLAAGLALFVVLDFTSIGE